MNNNKICMIFLIKKQQAEQNRQANVIAEEGVARTADLIGKALDEAGFFARLKKKEEQIKNSLDDIKVSNTIEMMNFDNLFRHFILTQSFLRGWANSLHLQEISTYRREKIDVRGECLKLVPAENVQQNTVEIIKQKIKSNQNYTNARFRSPLANYLLYI
ncbi:unnamed protein product, partial [Rotaria sordida]